MKAYVIRKWGDIDQLSLESIQIPSPSPSEVLIEVKAIGLNPIDYIILGGALTDQLRLPVVIGSDVAGIVKEVGSAVTTLRAGDEVMGLINFPGTDGTIAGRGYAEFVTAPADQLIQKPKQLSFTSAAALPAVGLTAWQALHQVANLQAGNTILIHGASGGVGHIAVQLAYQLGAHVTATARAEHHDFLAALGAETIIDYQQHKFDKKVHGLDFVFDTVGGDVMRRSLSVLKTGGLLVTAQWPELDSVQDEAGQRGVTAKAVYVHTDAADLAELADRASSPALQVTVDKVYPFEELPGALARLKAHGVRGKLVISMGES